MRTPYVSQRPFAWTSSGTWLHHMMSFCQNILFRAAPLPPSCSWPFTLVLFSYFTRGTVRESITFGIRTVVQRTQLGARQSVGMQDVPFIIHVYVRYDGLTGVVVSDNDYPQRVAFGLIAKTMQTFDDKVQDKWTRVTADQSVEPQFMKDDLDLYQDPKNDKICKVQQDLDDIKEILHTTMQDLMARGETLEHLMEVSKDLSATSKQFAKKAKSTNSCCRSW